MASWLEVAAPAVLDEYRALFVHHDKLKVVGLDEETEIVHLRARDGSFVVFDPLKAEAHGALLDDDAAVKFFARSINGLAKCGETMQVEFSQAFVNLKKRDGTLFDEVMQRFLTNTYKDTDTPLWNKIMDELNVKDESSYLVRSRTRRRPSSFYSTTSSVTSG